MMPMDIQQILKLLPHLLGQIRVSGQDDVKRLNACFELLAKLQTLLPPPAA